MKSKGLAIVLAALGLMLLVVTGFLAFKKLRPEQAGILIESSPPAVVFIDGQQVGRTPYDASRGPGEIVVKLVPIAVDEPLVPWEAKVTLTAGIRTVIRRAISDTNETSAGEIISFEKIDAATTALSIVSNPDLAQLSLDGQVRGFTPIKIPSITPGEHQVIITAPNYLERSLNIKAEKGYRLTAVVDLAQSSDGENVATPSAEASPQPQKEEKKTGVVVVEILSTPTGFLRVRSEPSTNATESGRVDPGDKFDLLSENSNGDWYQIEFEKGKKGWVSSQYAKKKTTAVTPTPSASPSPTPRAR